ncbi:ABC transporter permease [Burkholderiaceae bacterium DAT-1]|nr:ABC transporter permease [Burkholderiaceae bacterium DAT-1]
MNWKDFRVACRLLIADKVYALVVLGGLAVAMATVLLLGAFIRNSLRIESVPAESNLMRVELSVSNQGREGDWVGYVPVPVKPKLGNLSGIAALSRYYPYDQSLRVGQTVLRRNFAFVDPDFPAMTGLRVLQGDVAAALVQPDAVAIRRALAVELFGHADALGKSLSVAGKPLRVVAILPDLAGYEHFDFDVLAGTESAAWTNRGFAINAWGHFHGSLFASLQPGADVSGIASQLVAVMDDSPWAQWMKPEERVNGHIARFRLIPFERMLLDGAFSRDILERAGGLALVGIAVLLLAFINYVNLTTLRTVRRTRELAMRKVLGASVGRVRMQFMAESVMTAWVAWIGGVFLAWLLSASFAHMIGMREGNILDLQNVLALLLLAIMVGVCASLWSWRTAGRIQPGEALAGRDHQETLPGRWFRRLLTVVQLATTMSIVCIGSVVYLQMEHLHQLDIGYDKRGLKWLMFAENRTVDPATLLARKQAFAAAVARIEGVTQVALAQNLPGNAGGVRNTGDYRLAGQPAGINLREETVDKHFFSLLHLSPLAGRTFVEDSPVDQSDECVLSESAAKAFGLTDLQHALGQFLRSDGGEGCRVVGVVKDVRHSSARVSDQTGPVMYVQSTFWLQGLIIRVSPDNWSGDLQVADLWRSYFPDDLLQYNDADQLYREAYQHDFVLGKLLLASSWVACLLGIGGLYALAGHNAERHYRQLVLRKLHGASSPRLLAFFLREPVMLLGLGLLVGVPVAWLGEYHYLARFSVAVEPGLLPWGVSMAICVLITLFASLRHAYRAANVRIVEALKA